MAGELKDRSGSFQQGRRARIARSATSRTRTKALRDSEKDLVAAKLSAYDREAGWCAICGTAPATELHHRLPRGMGGSAHNDQIHALSHIIWICADDHAQLERQDRENAYALGYLVHRGVQVPAEVSLMYRGHWVLLSDDGAVEYQ